MFLIPQINSMSFKKKMFNPSLLLQFKMMFGNESLRNSLFNINSIKSPRKQFEELVVDLESKLYDFIKVH